MKTFEEYINESNLSVNFVKEFLNKKKNQDAAFRHLKEDPSIIQYLDNPSLEMQKYALSQDPTLINLIKNLDPELAKKYKATKKTKDLGII